MSTVKIPPVLRGSTGGVKDVDVEGADVGAVLRALAASGRAVGMDVTIYNPALDGDGAAARAVVRALLAGLR